MVVVACCSSGVESFQKVILLLEREHVHTRERGYAQVQTLHSVFVVLRHLAIVEPSATMTA